MAVNFELIIEFATPYPVSIRSAARSIRSPCWREVRMRHDLDWRTIGTGVTKRGVVKDERRNYPFNEKRVDYNLV